MTLTIPSPSVQAGVGVQAHADDPRARTGLVRLAASADDAQRRALTQRELQVLTLVASGSTRESVARELGMAPDTVASHISRIYLALGAHNAAHAVALAHAYGVLPTR